MSRVKALGYIGCEVKDTKAWEELLDTVFGLAKRTDSPKGVDQYRIDDYHHRIALHKSKQDKLAYLGWELETQEQLDVLVSDLKKKKIKVKKGTAKECADRAVKEMHVVTGPDNVRHELFFGPVQDFVPFSSTLGIEGYKTGELGMGHVVLAASDPDAAMKWYQDNLGFLLSDYIHWDGIEATFMHCNPRHHSLAITNEIGHMKGGDLNHFMLESLNADDVGRAYDAVNEKKIPVAFTYGKHTNDQTTSYYIYTPSGWLIEYGYGGMLIDDNEWEPKFYNSPKIWGHEFQPPDGS